MSKEKIILIGGGGHCVSCIDVIENENQYSIAGIVDLPEKVGEKLLCYEIIASDKDLEKLFHDYNNFFITLGQIGIPKRRIELFKQLKKNQVNIPVIISPIAYVSKYAEIGEGTIIMHHAVLNANAQIGSNCIINSKALIEHDAVVKDNCHIATAAVVNGGVEVGENTFWGSAAVSKQYTIIPPNSFIKANSIYK